MSPDIQDKNPPFINKNNENPSSNTTESQNKSLINIHSLKFINQDLENKYLNNIIEKQGHITLMSYSLVNLIYLIAFMILGINRNLSTAAILVSLIFAKVILFFFIGKKIKINTHFLNLVTTIYNLLQSVFIIIIIISPEQLMNIENQAQ